MNASVSDPISRILISKATKPRAFIETDKARGARTSWILLSPELFYQLEIIEVRCFQTATSRHNPVIATLKRRYSAAPMQRTSHRSLSPHVLQHTVEEAELHNQDVETTLRVAQSTLSSPPKTPQRGRRPSVVFAATIAQAQPVEPHDTDASDEASDRLLKDPRHKGLLPGGQNPKMSVKDFDARYPSLLERLNSQMLRFHQTAQLVEEVENLVHRNEFALQYSCETLERTNRWMLQCSNEVQDAKELQDKLENVLASVEKLDIVQKTPVDVMVAEEFAVIASRDAALEEGRILAEEMERNKRALELKLGAPGYERVLQHHRRRLLEIERIIEDEEIALGQFTPKPTPASTNYGISLPWVRKLPARGSERQLREWGTASPPR